MMQDNKALQAGTSHNLGQNFAKAFEVRYQTAAGGLEYVWNTSWGVTTRLVGGLIMTHGDDVGMICPPKLAPVQVVMVPIYKTDTEKAAVLEVCEKAVAALLGDGIRAEMDARESMKPGAKYFEHEARGVPLRLEVGPRDVGQGQVMAAKRLGGKMPLKLVGLVDEVKHLLSQIQNELLEAARTRRDQASRRGLSKADFVAMMNGPGGFAYGGFCGGGQCEAEIKEQTKATVRVLPDEEFQSHPAPTTCQWCGKPSVVEAVWARAY
jgi:prolyl-tRNA synthetase